MLLLTHTDNQVIRQRLAAEMAEVESRFAAELASELPCVNSLVSHVERYPANLPLRNDSVGHQQFR